MEHLQTHRVGAEGAIVWVGDETCFFFIILIFKFISVCVYVCVCLWVCMGHGIIWRSEDNLRGLDLSPPCGFQGLNTGR